MIKSITLKNWKSFGEATLYVDPLTVLIGTNASGKSNFLDALVFLGELMRTGTVEGALNGGSGQQDAIRGGEGYIIRKGATVTTIEVVIINSEIFTYRYTITLRKGTGNGLVIAEEAIFCTVGEKGEESLIFEREPYQEGKDKFAVLLPSNPKEDTGNLTVKPNGSIILSVLGSSLSEGFVSMVSVVMRDLNMLVLDPIPQQMRGFKKMAYVLKGNASNLAGYLANLHPNVQGDVQNGIVNGLRNLPENEILKVWAEPVGLLAKDAMLYCEERWPGETVPLLVDSDGLSDGTLRLIAILTALLTARRGSTLVIEEIDNGIHPSRAKLLVKLLREIGTERKVDIICTTHNPALLDAFGLSMLPFIALVYRDPENGTSQIKNLDEIEHYERIITKGTLGDLITKGRFESVLKAH
ncbi:MAG: AAA family ATPase [Lewinella sp.]